MLNNQVKPKKTLNINLNFLLEKIQPISLAQKIFLVQHLKVMLRAGVSLSATLETLARQTSNQRFKRILGSISQEVEKGNPLAQSLGKFPKVFSAFFINMIKAGETSGRLEETLKELHLGMKKDHELISKVKGALIYPVVIITAMIGIGILMIIFVIPKITELFQEVQVELPLATRILIDLSNFTTDNGLWVGLGVVIVILLVTKVLTTKKGEYYFHLILLKLPVISPIIKKINLARFSRTLSSLLKTDIPIVQTFHITSSVVGNTLYQKALREAAEKIKKGLSLKDVLKNYEKLFPPMVTQMVTVGEASGALEEVLSELADFYEEEITEIMKNLPSIIEPILILILGGAVGLMAVAIITPMYSLSQQF